MARLGLFVSWFIMLAGSLPGLALSSGVYQPCEPSEALLAAKEACARGDASAAQQLSHEAHARFAAAEERLIEVVKQRQAAMAAVRMRRP